MSKALIFALLNGIAALVFTYFWYGGFDTPSLIVLLICGFLTLFILSFFAWKVFENLSSGSKFITPLLAGVPVGLSAPFVWQALTVIGNRICYHGFGSCIPMYQDALPPFSVKEVFREIFVQWLYQFLPLISTSFYAVLSTVLIGILVNFSVKETAR